LVLALTGCRESHQELAAWKPDATQQASDLTIGKEELLARLDAAGLAPETRPAPESASRVEELVAELKPTSRFLLGVDHEGMYAMEFASTDLARRMEQEEAAGFRYRNWFFHGRVTLEVTRAVQRALENETG
jgi:hypothetical protein